MEQIIVTTPSELRALIAEECERLYDRISNMQPAPKDEYGEVLQLDKAVEFLNEQGFKIAQRTLYILSSKGEVPTLKFNGRVTFNRNELLNWARCRAERKTTKRQATIAQTRNRA